MANPPPEPKNFLPYVLPAGVPKDAIPLSTNRPNPISKQNGGFVPALVPVSQRPPVVQRLVGQNLIYQPPHRKILSPGFPLAVPVQRAPLLILPVRQPQPPPGLAQPPPHNQSESPKKQNRSQKKAEHKLWRGAQPPPVRKPQLPPVNFTKDNFEDQCQEMISAIEMTPSQREWIPEVLHDVEEVYRCVLPELFPKLYGSSFTGIAFKTSDFDVHLHCHGKFKPDINFISKNGHFLYRSSRFSNTIKVGRARVPVMKTTHISGIDLDISATSQHAVHNSILLRFIMDSDPRIRHLTMLISYWAKRNNISGMNLFTSYSIVLMVVFYLQRIEPPILPPMRSLLYRRENDGWPYAVKKDAKIESSNETKISELFENFFEFYHNKDFSKKVLSTYLGKEMSVDDFSNYETLTDELTAYKREVALGETPILISNIIHVQDPIELNINTTRSVKPDLLKLFKEAVAKKVEKHKKLPSNKWLHELTTEEPTVMKKKDRKIQVIISYPKEGENWFDDFNQDFKTTCDLLLFEVEDKMDKNKFIKVDSDGSKKRTQFTYLLSSIHTPKLNKPFKELINELRNGMQFEIFKEKLTKMVPSNLRRNKFSLSADISASYVPKKGKDRSLYVLFSDVNNESDFFVVTKGLAVTFNTVMTVARCTRMGIPYQRGVVKNDEKPENPKPSVLLLHNIEKHAKVDEPAKMEEPCEKMEVVENQTHEKKRNKKRKKKKKGLNNLEQLLEPLPTIQPASEPKSFQENNQSS